jgi:trimethylamine---corrinoid protein Co-methyltransferase
MHPVRNPQLRFLSEPVILKIIDEARDVLTNVGVMIENDDAVRLLNDHGLAYDESKKIVKFKTDIIDQALKTAPSKIEVFDQTGDLCMNLSDQNIHFDPGSAALHILDFETNKSRKAYTSDVVQFVKLENSLPHFAAQSTGLIASDVPEDISDIYRLLLALQFCQKPVVTGTFNIDGFAIMKNMLVAIRGSENALREKPLAIFDCCPSPPLKWSNLTCHDLMECAKTRIPAELVSMPLTGATSPATILGALVQLTAENLSGIVIHQLTNPGAPIIFGGSPAAFDMRTGTTPMGAIETMMIDCAYAQIGRELGLPTHAYMALSDAKQLDAQAGFETGMGAVLAALTGINVISGPGMLDFESCQSLEKLVIDHEICGNTIRMKKGIFAHHEMFADDLYGDIYNGEFFLTSPNTLESFRKEFYFPDPVIDRKNLQDWLGSGGETLMERAHNRVKYLLDSYVENPLDINIKNELNQIMLSSAKKYGLEKLPKIS